jgi:hypothetical protein
MELGVLRVGRRISRKAIDAPCDTLEATARSELYKCIWRDSGSLGRPGRYDPVVIFRNEGEGIEGWGH